MTVAYLTNSAYGYPRGAQRRIAPRRLLCIHITGNAKNLAPGAAMNERNYANRPNSGGPSAHAYVDRDGSVVWAIDPVKYAAWSNGDVSSPNLRVPGVEETVGLLAKGYNPNEDFVLEVECVGYPAIADINEAQLAAVAAMLNEQARRTGLPITRGTVHTHADYNTVNRANCAFRPSIREPQMRHLIELANLSMPPTDTEDDVYLTQIKGEDWRPAGERRPVRDKPDRPGGTIIGYIETTQIVRTIAEATTADGNVWRLTEFNGKPGWLLRSDFNPLVQGGDPATDAGLTSYIARKSDDTPYDDDDLAAARAGATLFERKRWTDWKATAPA